jgi:hypothetical protein
MEQIIDQGRQAAIATIRRAFETDPTVRIVGDPEVTAIYAPAKAIR